MQIKNIAFDKKDFKYSIEYFDGKAVRKVSTNEEALNSFDMAVLVLAKNLKAYLKISDSQSLTVNKIKFGANDLCKSAVSLFAFGAGVEMKISTQIRPVSKEEHFPDELLVACNQSIEEVRGEIDRYLNGEKSQREFSFDDELDDFTEVGDEERRE